MNTVGIIAGARPPPLTRMSRCTGSTSRKYSAHTSKPNRQAASTAIAATVPVAAANVIHRRVSISISGTRRPSCGLTVSRPKQIPATIGRRSSHFKALLIRVAVMNPIWPVNTLMATAGATASMGNRSRREKPSDAAQR